MDLAGSTVLHHVVSRCMAIAGVDVVCCAVPAGAADDAVAEEAARHGAVVFRGSELDVLDRYYRAALECRADVVVRVTSDCPLLDPVLAAGVLSLVTRDGAGYACNNLPPSWPHGLDCEAFPFAWLERAAREARLPSEREHVTPYLRNHRDVHKLSLHGPGGRALDHRWTLDNEADLCFLRALFQRLPPGAAGYDYRVPLMIVEQDPALAAMNAGQDRDAGLRKSLVQDENAAYLPYGRHTVTDEDVEAVVEVLRSDWLTTGPAVDTFEAAMAAHTGAKYAVALSSGTSALHAAMYAVGIGPGDEVIVPPLTFVATANAVVYCGGRPVFADVSPGSLLIDPRAVAGRITSRTRAIVAVDYAGQPCDYEDLAAIARRHNLVLVADACHALGATYQNRNAGRLADLSTLSFHPVKHITTGEGGMVTTDDGRFANRIRAFRNHGITTDHRQRSEQGSFRYEMVDLGFNYRISDLQCALGTSQLKKAAQWLRRRRAIAAAYDGHFEGQSRIRPLERLPDREHAYHLYVIRVAQGSPPSRDQVFTRLRQFGIGCNVHYIPVHLQPFYRARFGYGEGLCPVAESAFQEILSLPIHPRMTDADVNRVVSSLASALEEATPA
jgi:perosamine synthetase